MRYRRQIIIIITLLTVAFISAAYMAPSKPFVTLPPGPRELTFQERWDGLNEWPDARRGITFFSK